jgi:hypothetical protein
MKIIKISWSGLSDKWSVTTANEGGNVYFEVFSSEDYGLCIVIASAYISVGYKMVDPNGHLRS